MTFAVSLSTVRGRMLALGLGTAFLVIVAAAAPFAALTRGDVEQAAHRDATSAALSAADFMSHGPLTDAHVLTEYLQRLRRRNGVAVTVIRPASDTVIGAPLTRDEIHEVLERQPLRQVGDHDHDDLRGVSMGPSLAIPHGRLVQVEVQGPAGVSRVLARIDDETVAALTWRRYEWLALAAIGLFALAAIAAEVTSRRLARPLQAAAATARALQAGDLHARARVTGPKEVAEVAGELNALADRIDDLLQQERETVADLSHRLRTPLTAVRLSAEALPHSPESDDLEHQIGALERALTSVIRSARRPLREGVVARADAEAIARDRVAFWRPLAEDQGREVREHIGEGPMWVRLSAEDLAATLDALLENVFAHTPEGTAFAVEVQRSDNGVVVDVLDDGAGIDPDAVARGSSGGASSGLGLDISRANAAASGGSLEILRGARSGVRLRLGSPL